MMYKVKRFSQSQKIEAREFGNKENKAKKNEWKLRQRIRENNLIDVENQRLQGMADELNSKKKWYQSKFKPESATEDEVLEKLKDGQKQVQDKLKAEARLKSGKNASTFYPKFKDSEDLFIKSQGTKPLGKHTSEAVHITDDIHGKINDTVGYSGSKERAKVLRLQRSNTNHISGAEAQERILKRKAEELASKSTPKVEQKATEEAAELVNNSKDKISKVGKGLSKNAKLGLGIAAGTAVIGGTTYGVHRYRKNKKAKSEE